MTASSGECYDNMSIAYIETGGDEIIILRTNLCNSPAVVIGEQNVLGESGYGEHKSKELKSTHVDKRSNT